MDEGLLREIATEYLVPFFSGAELEEQRINSSPREALVAFRDPVSIAFKIKREDAYRLILTRAQPFAMAGGTLPVPEIEIVRAFVDVVGSMATVSRELQHDLLSTFQRRVVAKAISSTEERETVLLAGIDQLVRWSSRLYEGSPVSAAIGFRHKPQDEHAPDLAQLGRHDFSAVISNGHDTLIEFDFAGRLISHRSLSSEGVPPPYCPFRQAPIAEWTARDEERRRVAMCLNRLGEILVFRDRQLLFARRSGRWSFLTHDPVITQMGTPHGMDIRKAVYETCLDASFARTGACIGIVSSSHVSEWPQIVVDQNDHLRASVSVKAMVINSMVSGRAFHELDRRLRQELAAIDGATVISHKGEVLAVGAILRIPGGSTGGGRLAAAKALGKLGLGIKVSQDGAISGFRTEHAEPAFRVM